MYAVTSLVVAALAAHGASAVNLSPDLFHGHTKAVLQLRQSGIDPGEIPAQCQSQCAIAVQALNGCADLTCLCTTRVNTGLQSCYNCLLALVPDTTTLLPQSQKAVSDYETSCKSGGFPLPSLTVSAGTPPATSAVASGASQISSTIPSITPTATSSTASLVLSTSATDSDTGVFSIPPLSTISHVTVSAAPGPSTVGPSSMGPSSSSPTSPTSSDGGSSGGANTGNGAVAVGAPHLAGVVSFVLGFALVLGNI